MLERGNRDLVAGSALTLIGAGAAAYSLVHYPVGTVTRMGPGMVPTSLGVILAVFGLAIAVPAVFRRGAAIDIRMIVPVFLVASIAAFALMIERFGLLPSVFATTVIASCAELKFRPLRTLILAAVLCTITWAIFIAGLQLPISTIAWPS